MLRSKDMDRDSYNSGDWFNASTSPTRATTGAPACHLLQEMLQVRKSSPLFRLRTAEEVQERLKFYNTGSDQIPGLLVYSLSGQSLDTEYGMIVVVLNSDPQAQTFTHEDLANLDFQLHPILAESADPVVREAAYDRESGTFSVPGRTAAVYAARQAGGGSPALSGYLPLLIAGGLLLVLAAALLAQLRSGEPAAEHRDHE
jgi:pullulanase